MVTKKIVALATAMTMLLTAGTVATTSTSLAAENDFDSTVESVDNQIEENNSININDYYDDGERFGDYTSVAGVYEAQAGSLPVSYDSRKKGYITSVKNQGEYNTSWAFAAMSAAEATLVKNKVATKPNLSEYHLAYFTYHAARDPLGMVASDQNEVSTNSNYLKIGGTNYDAMFSLAGWKGAVNETRAKYSNASAKSTLNESLAFDGNYHMQSADIVSVKNKNDVKSLIVKNGAVASSVAFDSRYYNEKTKSYYQNTYTFSNNAVAIIGWDDNYAITKFKADKSPKSPGAWLVKNSWGDYMDYVWVSYEDTSIRNADAVAYTMEAKSNYDIIYQYDGTTSTGYQFINNKDCVANIYKVAGKSKQTINAVAIALADDNIRYSVQIYQNPVVGKPTSGTPLLDTPMTGVIAYPGYHTLKLPKGVLLNQGDTFSVVFKLEDLNANDSSVKIFCDTTESKTIESAGTVIGTVNHINTTAVGQSYICYSKTGAYTDLNTKSSSARIKAFAKDYTVYDLSKSKIIVNDKTYTGKKVTPAVKVLINGTLLKRGTDFTVSYSNNINPGKATVKVTGIGKYYGSKTASFKIVKATTVYKNVDYKDVYDFAYYTNKHPELVKKYGYNDKKILAYFVKNGMKAGHQANASFNPKYYGYRYVDLRRSYKNNLKKYYIHYMETGKSEGRKGTYINKMMNYATVYDGLDYVCVYNYNYFAKHYPSAVKKFGLDDEAALKYFVNTGMKKAYRGSKEFDPKIYKARYNDLAKKYGNKWKKYYIHYIKVGKKNGRKGN